MPRPRSAFAAYQAAIETTPPLQAVVLLHDGILTRIRTATAAAERGDYCAQFDDVVRAIDILRGLVAALDPRRGGAVAERLRDTYETNMRALMRTVGRADAAHCLGRISDGLRTLRDAWAEIAGMPAAAPAADKPL